MVEIAKKYNMNEMNIKNCFVIGISRDIGYEFSLNKSDDFINLPTLETNPYEKGV